MPVAIVTDSSACLPEDLARAHGIAVLPIAIHVADADLQDGMPGAAERVYRALRSGEPVKSSAPSPDEYLAAIAGADADEVLVITPATEFTGMYRSASLAAELAGARVVVHDSRTAAAAQGLVVLAAAEAARRAGLEEAARAAEEASARAELVAALDGLEHITRSGRVPAFALGLARRLGVRPVFRFRDGEVDRVGVPRSLEAAIDRIAREWSSRGGADAPRAAVFHAAAPDRAGALRMRLGAGALVTEFSPSMGIHTGPGVVGAAWLRSS
jgi:DegV family protein with EDD domain